MTDDVKDVSASAKKSPRTIDSGLQFKGFFINDHHAYVARKSERLSTAIHLVTSYIPKEEPLRSLLRTGSLEIGQLTMDPAKLAAAGPGGFGTRCMEVSSLLDTAQASGYISEMNARLIIEEYARLADFVKERYAFIRSQVSDVKDDKQVQTAKGQKDIGQEVAVRSESIKDIQRSSSRRQDILAIFNNKERISIKDTVDAIHGVSEKTLQRELLSMVEEGILKKEGERRWSTYIRV